MACLAEAIPTSSRPPSLSWAVIRTKARDEQRACQHLLLRGVEPYCPRILLPPWHRRAPRRPVPLFPGYVFVRCALGFHQRAIRYCPGVLCTLAFEGQVATVEEPVIAELKRREAEHGFILPPEDLRRIQANSTVRVMSGPFRGYEAVFTGYLRGGDRAMLLMHMLRVRRRIEVDADSLQVVRGPA